MSRRFVELENIIDFVLVDFTGTCCEAIPKLSKVGVDPTESGNHRESKFGYFSHITTTTTSIILSPCLLGRFHPYPPTCTHKSWHPLRLSCPCFRVSGLKACHQQLGIFGVGPFLMIIIRIF